MELVEDFLDAPSDEKIEIYIYPSLPPRCWGAFSCYDERRDMIRIHWSFLGHEIVHAVVDRFAQPPPFWNEGIAEALDRTASFGGSATVLDSIHVSDWRRGTVSILGGVQPWGSTQGLPSVRVDQVDAAMGLAWQPRRSRVAVFVAMRATSTTTRDADGPEVRQAVGALAGIRIALPSLVQILRRWRRTFGDG